MECGAGSMWSVMQGAFEALPGDSGRERARYKIVITGAYRALARLGGERNVEHLEHKEEGGEQSDDWSVKDIIRKKKK